MTGHLLAVRLSCSPPPPVCSLAETILPPSTPPPPFSHPDLITPGRGKLVPKAALSIPQIPIIRPICTCVNEGSP
ncbi:hypothetical protein BOTBODRAFT_32300 [Botryobasidium botryosum FD-172 SS1]|uniref:Uncharacterized protein n=1 Tax=Botryobasidium botryosum (strain FD-172 SS1) TaxID=930990 RepID=A0A067MGL4_BOTB1|nr:hypothetical protein BOTBODRAFT_32300 [Botryobasidium botryosum FD-172 SS1]